MSFVVAVVEEHKTAHLKQDDHKTAHPELEQDDHKEVDHSFEGHYSILNHYFPNEGHYCPSPYEAYSYCFPSY